MTWAAQCMQGGYLGSLAPDELFFQPEEPEFREDELEWDLPYVHIDNAGLRGLLHFFEALHLSGVRLDEVTMG